MNALLRIKKLKLNALHIDDLEVVPGEIVLLSNHTSSNIASLIKILSLQETFNEGNVEIFGTDLATLDDEIVKRNHRKKIASLELLLSETIGEKECRHYYNLISEKSDYNEASHVFDKSFGFIKNKVDDIVYFNLKRIFINQPQLIFINHTLDALPFDQVKLVVHAISKHIKYHPVSVILYTNSNEMLSWTTLRQYEAKQNVVMPKY